MTRKTPPLEAAIYRADDILCRTTEDHYLVTVRRADLLALVLAAEADYELARCREKLSDALSADGGHRSDCAVFNAPAMEPGPCDCGRARVAA